MELNNSEKLSERVKELFEEEMELKNSLTSNANSLSQDEVQKVEESLATIRREREQLSNIIYDGFYD